MAGSNGQLMNIGNRTMPTMYGNRPMFSGYSSPFNYNALAYGLSGLQGSPQVPPQYQGPQLDYTGLNIPGAPQTQGTPQIPQLSRIQQRFLNRDERN